MSVVIVGGNERMVCQYENICKGYGCKAKVFAKEKGTMKKKIGAPDLLILFTNTVSHKMVNCAVEEAKRKSIPDHFRWCHFALYVSGFWDFYAETPCRIITCKQ